MADMARAEGIGRSKTVSGPNLRVRGKAEIDLG